MAKGADVSRWQGIIDFAKMKSQCDFVFVKVSESNFTDSMFSANWRGAKAAGLQRGGYHFYRVVTDASIQARVFIQAMAGDYGELPPVVDMEDTNQTTQWTLKQVSDFQWFLDVVEKFTGKKPIIYTAGWWWNPHMGLMQNAADYPLWVANWKPAPTGLPLLPAAWTTYKYWQWTSSGNGPLYGVASDTIDLDITADATPPPPVVYPPITFTADHTVITVGNPVTLSWSVEGVEGVWLDNKGVAGQASEVFTPTASTTYTLVVKYRDMTMTGRTVNVTVNQPQPQPQPAQVHIGFNALADGGAAGGAYNQGARFFLMMNDTDTANKLAALPDTTVMYRQYWDHNPSDDELVNALGTRLHPAVIRTFINEDEKRDGKNIKACADQDIRVTNRLHAINPNYRCAAKSSAMGTPDFTDAAICDAIRQYYAPAYNAGVIWFDMHLYSPNMNHIYQDAEVIWYETRWLWLFSKCGFNPTVRHIVSGECGVDEGGVGGFPAHHATNEQVVAYCKRWLQIQSAPIYINGVSYPSPFVGGAIFQLGNAAGWQGYDMRGYTAAMQAAGVLS